MKKSFGLGKKNLYLGFAFLVVVGLLSLFMFSGVREGFYNGDSITAAAISSSDIAVAATTLTADQVAGLTTADKKCRGNSTSVNANTGERIQCSNFTSQTSCVKPCTWN